MASDCAKCDGIGWRHVAGGALARAEVCECVRACPDCRGDRYRIVLRDGYEFAEPCHCQGTSLRVAAFNEARIPADYGRKHLSGFVAEGEPQNRAKTFVAHFVRKFDPDSSRGFLLLGGPGTGKTHLLSAVVAQLTLEQGIRAAYVDFALLVSEIRATFGNPAGGDQEDLVGPLAEVPVLAIDELGKGVRTEWERTVFDELVTRRYNAGLIVLAASNLYPESHLPASPEPPPSAPRRLKSAPRVETGETLDEAIGRRAWSRLAEMCEVLDVHGADRRIRR